MSIGDMSFDQESEQIRDVFERFGIALFRAQCLETQIAILLSGQYAPTREKLTSGRIDDLLETSLDQTFGALVKELKKRATLPADIDDKLERAVKKRNWLAHYYWWDRASEITTFPGREKMLAELTELSALFGELDKYLVKNAQDWLTGIGVTQEILDASLAKLLSGPTPPRKARRKLNKVETLINAYIYMLDEDGKKGDFLFELADHTFWNFCDCGLAYYPEQIDFARLRPAPGFEKVLPAEITPRPRGAKDWKYRIPLSTGFDIWVAPYEGGGEYEFKCWLSKSK